MENGNGFIIREVFEDVCESHQRIILESCQNLFEAVVKELYLKMKDKEGEWEMTDEMYDVIHEEIDHYLEGEETLCEDILKEYGLNQAFKDYIEEYGFGSINKENVSGCLVFHILKQQLLYTVPNQLWEDIVKLMIETGEGDDEFVFERE